jgi:hypothetical protein
MGQEWRISIFLTKNKVPINKFEHLLGYTQWGIRKVNYIILSQEAGLRGWTNSKNAVR